MSSIGGSSSNFNNSNSGNKVNVGLFGSAAKADLDWNGSATQPLPLQIQFQSLYQKFQLPASGSADDYVLQLVDASHGNIPVPFASNILRSSSSSPSYIADDSDLQTVIPLLLNNSNTNQLALMFKLKPALHATQIINNLRPPQPGASHTSSEQQQQVVLKKKALFEIRQLFKDSAFFQAFVQQGGTEVLMRQCMDMETTGNFLAYSFNALQQLIMAALQSDNNVNLHSLLLARQQHQHDILLSLMQRVIACLAQFHSTNLNITRAAIDLLLALSSPQPQSPTSPTATGGSSSSDNIVSLLFQAFVQQQQQPGQQLDTSLQKPFAILIKLLGSTDVNIQCGALNLVNNFIAYSLTASNTNSASISNNSSSNVNKRLSNSHFLAMTTIPSPHDLIKSVLQPLGILTVLKQHMTTSDPEFRRQLLSYQRHMLSIYGGEKNTAYRRDVPQHEALLMRLWAATFPEVSLNSRVSEQWKQLGFQGTDPATDFRGMGLLGLHQLLYFAENPQYTKTFRRIISTQMARSSIASAGEMSRDYPAAVSGINITGMLVELFQVNDISQPQQQQQSVESFDATNAAPLFAVLFDDTPAKQQQIQSSSQQQSQQQQSGGSSTDEVFHEVYCRCFELFDRTWDEMRASYMDFPKVIASVKKKVSDVLLQHNPPTLEAFTQALQNKYLPPSAQQQQQQRQQQQLIQQQQPQLIQGFISKSPFFDADDNARHAMLTGVISALDMAASSPSPGVGVGGGSGNSSIAKLRQQIRNYTLHQIIRKQKTTALQRATCFRLAAPSLASSSSSSAAASRSKLASSTGVTNNQGQLQQHQQVPLMYLRLSEDCQELLSAAVVSATVDPALLNFTPIMRIGDISEVLTGNSVAAALASASSSAAATNNAPNSSPQLALKSSAGKRPNNANTSNITDDMGGVPLGFSLIYKNSLSSSSPSSASAAKTLDLVAFSRDDFMAWTDGLQLLMLFAKATTSTTTSSSAHTPEQRSQQNAMLMSVIENNMPSLKEEMNFLVNLQLRIKLLELEGVLLAATAGSTSSGTGTPASPSSRIGGLAGSASTTAAASANAAAQRQLLQMLPNEPPKLPPLPDNFYFCS